MSDENETSRQCGDEKSQSGDAGKFRIDEMVATPPPQDENDVEACRLYVSGQRVSPIAQLN